MRFPLTLLLAACGPALTAPSASAAAVLIATFFERPCPDATIQAMHHELEAMMLHADITPQWTIVGDPTQPALGVVRVRVGVRGNCHIGKVHEPKSNALGETLIAGGEILPFIYINCDAIVLLIKDDLRGDNAQRVDETLGRAMARVLAHELYHVLACTRVHGNSRITRPNMDSGQLLGTSIRFDRSDLEHLESNGCHSGATLAARHTAVPPNAF